MGIMNYYKDFKATAGSYELYDRKVRGILEYYEGMNTASYGLGIMTEKQYSLAFLNEKNLVTLLNMIYNKITTDGYSRECINEIENPKLFVEKINKRFNMNHSSMKYEGGRLMNEESEFRKLIIENMKKECINYFHKFGILNKKGSAQAGPFFCMLLNF